MRPVLLSIALLGSGACRPCATACEALPDAPTEVQLGTGERAWEAVPEGGTLVIRSGPQGGYHVFASLVASGFLPGTPTDVTDPCNPVVDFDLTTDDGTVRDVYQEVSRPLRANGAAYELVGDTVTLDLTEDEVAAAVGKAATLSVVVRDPCGHEAQDARAVVLDWAPDDGETARRGP
ncbi:MAG: hypothetical protein H6733_03055 [Alphaproteobacteria bacterium]|nr:hypothetical protein [Alphaproteobacteria bacterium]